MVNCLVGEDVYEFREDGDKEVANGFETTSGRLRAHRQYMRYSLSKHLPKFSKQLSEELARNELKIRLIIKKWNNKREVKEYNYKQFCSQYINVVKTYYPFLPFGQIREMTRRLWNRLKRKQKSNPSFQYAINQRLPKSSMKSLTSIRTKKSEKRVSFDLSDNHLELALDSVCKTTDNSGLKSSSKWSENCKSKPKSLSKYVGCLERLPKVSVPLDLMTKIHFNLSKLSETNDSLCDLFDKDVSQSDHELAQNYEPIIC